jgi:hypothetical protein
LEIVEWTFHVGLEGSREEDEEESAAEGEDGVRMRIWEDREATI